MRILVLSIGTQGDIQPFVAVGMGLKKAGHKVSVCTHEIFKAFVERNGLGYEYLNNDLQDFMKSDDGRFTMENSTNLLRTVRVAMRILPQLKKLQESLAGRQAHRNLSLFR